MKKICMSLAALAVILGSAMLTGCKKEKPAAPAAAVEKAAEQPAAAPAAQKPKDHPAH